MRLPTKPEIHLMIESARTLRDKILLRLLYETGCKPREAVIIKVRDINIRTATVYIAAHGNKPARLSYISIDLARDIAAYTSKANPTDYLFSMSKTEPLTPKRVSQIVEELSMKALKHKLTPLQIRYTHMQQALKFGIPLIEIQRQVGLDSARAMQLYNQLSTE